MLFTRGALCCSFLFATACTPTPRASSPTLPAVESSAPEITPSSAPAPEAIATIAAPQDKPPPPAPKDSTPSPVEIKSPFRQVLDEEWGSVHEHKGRRLWLGDDGLFDLSTGEALSTCPDVRGHLMSGKNLYFAARLSPFSACPDDPMLLEYVSHKWKLRRFIDAHDLLISEWKYRTSIAAVVPSRSGPPWGYELTKIAGNATPPRPQQLRPASSKHNDDSSNCYTVLQRPTSLHTFTDGTIMVVGESRCTPPDEREELSEEEELALEHPLIETFPSGHAPSTITQLPIGAVVHTLAGADGRLWILGKQDSWSPNSEEDPERQLFHFDGSNLKQLSAPPLGTLQILNGPKDETATELLSLWALTKSELRPLDGKAEALLLPTSCANAFAWFESDFAWLVCGDGLYTTDPEQETLTFANETAEPGDCKGLNPRPSYSVPGVYERAFTPGGSCGRERRAPKWHDNKNLPSPRPAPKQKRRPRLRY